MSAAGANATSKVKVGVVGCGAISKVYLANCRGFESLEVVACADLNPKRARERAAEVGCRASAVESLLADPAIEVVLNLTTPDAHASVAMAAIQAGKSVYNEKPLTITRSEARRLLAAAAKRSLLVGGAPDTFMGGGMQTCRRLIDQGAIGAPVAATAFMMCHGHESWHSDPAFYYQAGAGPMFDMGPYYVTALVSLLGPVSRVTGSTRITFKTRTITSRPKRGRKIAVKVPTHVAGVLDFGGPRGRRGPIATIVTSFDVWAADVPCIEIYGTEGTLSVPDPNGFGGPVRFRRAGSSQWEEATVWHGYVENSRGIGLADMARALRAPKQRGRHRASGELAFHVLDVMQAIHESSDRGRHIRLSSGCPRPEPVPVDWRG